MLNECLVFVSKCKTLKELAEQNNLNGLDVIKDIIIEVYDVYFNQNLSQNYKIDLLNELYKEAFKIVNRHISTENPLFSTMSLEIYLSNNEVIKDDFEIFDFYDGEKMVVSKGETIILKWFDTLENGLEKWFFYKTTKRNVLKYLNNLLTEKQLEQLSECKTLIRNDVYNFIEETKNI